ncbi:MAG: PASTA domain-containing protein [Thermovirgaceae bacterium]
MKKMFRVTLLITLLVIVGSGVFAFYSIFFGFRDVAVPGMEGMTVVDAVSVTEKMGLLVRIDEVESLLPAGTVVSQWPETGTTIKKGKVIVLKVSKGGKRRPVPDVRGMEYGQSVTHLGEKGFEIGDVVRIHNDSRPPGVIIAQSPAAPAMAPENRRIDLLVSLGVPRVNGQIRVPNVLDRSEDVARQIIGQSGLRIGGVKYEYTLMTPSGMVMDTEPRPGKTLSEGEPVTLLVATAKKPDKTEETTDQAEEQEQKEQQTGTETPEVEQTPEQEPENGRPAPAPSPLDEWLKTPQAGQSPSTTEPVPEEQAQEPQETQKPEKSQEKSESESKEATKTAKIRYQVPPLARSMSVRVEIIDDNGTRTLLDRQAKSGEYIVLDAPYAGEAAVTIYLGGEFVWQDRYR